MNIYYFIFIWIALFAFLSQQVRVKHAINVNGEIVLRWRFVYAFLAFAPVIYLAAFTMPRSDTVLYLTIYRNLPETWEGFKSLIKESESGFGFLFFEWVINRLSSGSEQVFRIAIAAVHCIPVLFVFRRYSENYLISLYLFVASGCHIGWMMNGLRQFMAVSIIMAATPFLLKKKYILTILFILLAATFHSSAILMLPVVFIVQGKAWNKKTLLFIVAAVILMYAFSRYTWLLDSMLQNTEYAGVMENAAEMGDDGVNPIRVLVNSIPMLLALFGRKHIDKENNAVTNVCVNMSVITTGLYLIAMVTSGIMIGRLPIYTSLYSFIFLPHVIKKTFKKESAQLITVLMIVLYFLYYLYAYRNF